MEDQPRPKSSPFQTKQFSLEAFRNLSPNLSKLCSPKEEMRLITDLGSFHDMVEFSFSILDFCCSFFMSFTEGIRQTCTQNYVTFFLPGFSETAFKALAVT